MSKAADLARTASASETALSNRNIVTNGAMQVAQRATSVTGLGANQSTCQTLDRWKFISASDGRLTMSQTADGPSGFANCMKLDCTTADTSIAANEYLFLAYNVEGQDVQQIKKGTSDAELITVSFYVKANAAFTFGVELYDLDNNRQITKLFATTTGWVKHSITFPADTTGAFGDDNAASLSLDFWLHAGSNYTSGTLNTAAWASNTNANRAAGIGSFYSSTDNNFFITGIQMEVGSVATPFEHRSYGQELALCQRYYLESRLPHLIATGNGENDNSTVLPSTMRAAPTVTLSSISNASMTVTTPTVNSFGWNGTTNNGAYGNYSFYFNCDSEL